MRRKGDRLMNADAVNWLIRFVNIYVLCSTIMEIKRVELY